MVRTLRERGVLGKDVRVPHLKAAPHFSVLKCFGGWMTIEEFRCASAFKNDRELTIVPDWIPIIPCGMAAMDHPVVVNIDDLSSSLSRQQRFSARQTGLRNTASRFHSTHIRRGLRRNALVLEPKKNLVSMYLKPKDE
jgi:hypothetical protein